MNNYWIKEEIKTEIKEYLRHTKIETQYSKLEGCGRSRLNKDSFSNKWIHQG